MWTANDPLLPLCPVWSSPLLTVPRAVRPKITHTLCDLSIADKAISLGIWFGHAGTDDGMHFWNSRRSLTLVVANRADNKTHVPLLIIISSDQVIAILCVIISSDQ